VVAAVAGDRGRSVVADGTADPLADEDALSGENQLFTGETPEQPLPEMAGIAPK